MRALRQRKHTWRYVPAFFLVVVGVFLQQSAFILLTPVVINIALFLVFWVTLLGERPLIQSFAETFIARYAAGPLSDAEVKYCRKVTQAWCLFFILNAFIAYWTVWYGSDVIWTLYNCCISYLFIGLFFVVEFLYRAYRFRRYIGLPGEGMLQKLFPPRLKEL